MGRSLSPIEVPSLLLDAGTSTRGAANPALLVDGVAETALPQQRFRIDDVGRLVSTHAPSERCLTVKGDAQVSEDASLVFWIPKQPAAQGQVFVWDEDNYLVSLSTGLALGTAQPIPIGSANSGNHALQLILVAVDSPLAIRWAWGSTEYDSEMMAPTDLARRPQQEVAVTETSEGVSSFDSLATFDASVDPRARDNHFMPVSIQSEVVIQPEMAAAAATVARVSYSPVNEAPAASENKPTRDDLPDAEGSLMQAVEGMALCAPWEVRTSNQWKNRCYFYNAETSESVWTLATSNLLPPSEAGAAAGASHKGHPETASAVVGATILGSATGLDPNPSPSELEASQLEPTPQSSAATQSLDNASLGSWACAMCTLVNDSAARVCSACEHPRASSAITATPQDAVASSTVPNLVSGSTAVRVPSPSLAPAAVVIGSGRYMRGEYAVKAGDTVQGVALRHCLKVNELKRMNRLTGTSELFTGQILIVPLLGAEGKPVSDPTPAPTNVLEPSAIMQNGNSSTSSSGSSSNRNSANNTSSDSANGKGSSIHGDSDDDGVDFEPRYAFSSAFRADSDERHTQTTTHSNRTRCPRCVNLRSANASRCASCSALLAKAQPPPPPPSEDNPSLTSSLSLGTPLNLFAAGFRSLINPVARAPPASSSSASAPAHLSEPNNTTSSSNASLAPPAAFDSLRSAVRNWVSKDDSGGRPTGQQHQAQVPPEARRHSGTEPAASMVKATRSSEESDLGSGATKASAAAAVVSVSGVSAVHCGGPILRGKSEVLRATHLVQLESVLPASVQGYAWKLLYSTSLHGAQLGTFYEKGKKEKKTLLVVQTLRGEVFGGFTSTSWSAQAAVVGRRNEYFGTGESFLFSFPHAPSTSSNEGETGSRKSSSSSSSLKNETRESSVRFYPWTGANQLTMLATSESIALGGGGGSFGLYLEDDFGSGSTGHCETFMNEPLCSQERFEVHTLELWGFEL